MSISALTSVEGASVLVTGGAGFIGSHFVDRLIQDGPRKVTVVDNFFLGNEENLRDARQKRDDLEVVRLDAADLAAMQDVVTSNDVDVVFDFAVIPLPTSLTYPAWTVNTNVGIVTTFCDLARRGLVDRYVHVSSSEAYGSARYVPMDEEHPHDAITPYAASKSAGDHIIQSYIQTFGIDATIVRPFNNIGPRQNPGSYAGIVPIVVRKVLRGETIQIFGDGEQTRDFVFARDTADAILSVFGSDACRREVLNVATGVETSINDLVRRILDVMGAGSHPVEHVEGRPGDVRRHCADVSKMKRLLGRSAPVISDDELAETVEWYRAVL
jgi:UDP-glucose 4-epimerase